MKKTIKTKGTLGLMGIIVLAALIVFCFTACDNGSTSSGDSLVDVIGDTVRLYNKTVVYENETSATNFAYRDWSDTPLSDYITGTPKVLISGGKLTIELDQPKSDKMKVIDTGNSESYPYTIDPSDTKYCSAFFCDPSGKYGLYPKYGDKLAVLVYVDKDVTIDSSNYNSTAFNMSGPTYDNVTLKKGWNYLIQDQSGGFPHPTIAARTLDSGFTWTVVKD
ncbi:MAG: hypothetical protein FWG07_02675 [Treponema sp.]|nr:hypothetical protein [Treponema sp.]